MSQSTTSALAVGTAIVFATLGFMTSRLVEARSVHPLPAVDERRLREEISIEKDNLLNGIAKDHDAEAARLESKSRSYRVATATVPVEHKANVPGPDAAALHNAAAERVQYEGDAFSDAAVEVLFDADNTPRIVSSTRKEKETTTRFYLNDRGGLFLVVRRTDVPVGGVDEDRWYFLAEEYATFTFRPASDAIPLGPGETSRTSYWYAPEKPSDIAALKAELRAALDRTD